MLSYTTLEEDKLLRVDFKGDLDIEATELFQQELLKKMEEFQSVNLNLKEVPFVDSSGMGLLIELVRTLNEQEISVKISNVTEEVFEVFELLQLPEILGKDVFV
ncbi:hypothetical protein GCM10011391_05340 [Pullulanibacillus camelliae]|uniref:Anti-sigma factor antagonist n=1 Tax=Pullulanibacillus camelliae TaxID=1707096 RepID=A0A8J2VGR7_9BACL|nr:STAS domain-containing protein [Pullulanibacillus camelliae]GGE29737.1 hypothetical protein GCM10011391_05340 [Pullulanibacillus camelliae]